MVKREGCFSTSTAAGFGVLTDQPRTVCVGVGQVRVFAFDSPLYNVLRHARARQSTNKKYRYLLGG